MKVLDTQPRELLVTTQYDKFKYLKGNRQVDPKHVATIRAKIEKEGNLTSEFPVTVNERMEVIDGQNRIAALSELNYPVYYVISKGSSLATVRMINVARYNWSWRDYAYSYASEGNVHYRDLLDFVDAFGFSFSIVDLYTNGGKRTQLAEYQDGEYKVLDRGQAYTLLSQLSDIREAMPFRIMAGAAKALFGIMTSPDYDHKRMLNKLTKHGSQLREWRSVKDWLRGFEDMYNLGQPETTKVRFF